jgi:probable selenium-dependent hydroxylase accessory protein YqeC
MTTNAEKINLTTRHTLSLAEALGVKPGEVISLVGGGGKTSLMFRLAGELAAAGYNVISTTTTRIMPPSAEESPCLVLDEDEEALIDKARAAFEKCRHITLARLMPDETKLKGLMPQTVDRLAQMKLADYIVNEADGAARQPLKAPNATEPVMPSSTSLVAAVVGIEAIGRPLSPDTAFRIENISRLTGLKEGEAITIEAVATLLTQPRGIIQYAPPGARILPFINKVDDSSLEAARQLAREVLSRRHPQITEVALGALKFPEREIEVVGKQWD